MQQNYCEDDEIDLLDLAKKIWKYKKQICIVTCGFIAVGLLYILFATPWYKATAVVETAYYNNETGMPQYITERSVRMHELRVKYIDGLKDIKDKNVTVDSIVADKDRAHIFIITALAKSIELLKKQIDEMVADLSKEDAIVLDEYKKAIREQLVSIDSQISYLKNDKIRNLKERIEYLKGVQIAKIDDQIDMLNKKEKLSDAGELKLMELMNIKDKILNDNIPKISDEISAITLVQIPDLMKKKSIIESRLSDFNFKTSHIISNIVLSDRPAKPKKLIILAISAIIGLMLSTFVVLVFDKFKTCNSENR